MISNKIREKEFFMELVYLWVDKYKNIQNQGFNFSPRFRCEYDEDTKELNIIDKDETGEFYPKNFFGDNINVTAIVGENGSGKSSLVKSFISGINYNTISYDIRRKLACYLNHEKNLIYIHTYIQNLNIKSNIKYEIENHQGSYYKTDKGFEKEKFESFYYLYQPNLDIEDKLYNGFEYNEKIIIYSEPNKRNNKIDLLEINIKMKRYILQYLVNTKKTKFQHSIFFNPTGIYFELNEDIFYKFFPREYDNDYVTFQKNNISNILLLMKLDIFIYFYFNNELLKNLQPNSTLNKLGELKSYLSFEISKQSIENNFLLLKEASNNILNSVEHTREEIKSNHNYSNDELSVFLNEVENIFLTIRDIESLTNLCTLDVHVGHINEYDINMKNFSQKSADILKHLPNHLSLEFYEKNGRALSDLSSGEQNILKMLYSIENIIHLRKNKSKTINIFLDEIENTLHPNWQKKLINILIEQFKEYKIQINFYISSHSPFILSDLAKENIIFLEKGKQVYPFEDEKQTFGANIHTLLSHGFFMDEKGLMGEFAKEKINQAYNFIVQKDTNFIKTKEEAQNIINLIGEPMLRKELQFLYDEKFEVDEIDKQIREYEEAIEKLKSKKKKND
jgi:predicted ATP-binding protein involved in virulence